jgi:type II secretory pathway pseudopilin PulG
MKNKMSINLEVSLVEMIFSILIFAISGAIILYCFSAARFTQIKANDKVKAGSIVQSHAEIIRSFQSSNEMNEYLSEHFANISSNENESTYFSYYDSDWNPCDEKSMNYIVSLKITNSPSTYGELKNIDIISERANPYPFIDRNNKNTQTIIYEINTKQFFMY